MALHLPISISGAKIVQLHHKPMVSRSIRVGIVASSKIITRRSANYQPTKWDNDYIQSLKNNPYKDNAQEEACNREAKELKEGVRKMLHNVDDLLLQLELIDILGRLGLAYHFEDQIKLIMNNIHYHFDNWRQDNVYSKALGFRLLRQYGYKVTAGSIRATAQRFIKAPANSRRCYNHSENNFTCKKQSV
ncbi:hypothetical protein ACFE04_021457 [Oxalis oulophora]